MYRVSPTEPDPTHHVLLRDRKGKEIGLILCDNNGQPLKGPGSFVKNPVETTAQKQTSGSSSYSDFDLPYSPIVQDDLSGGRGSIDFERDSTKYYDSYKTKSGRANKAYAGPQEQYTTGVRSINQNMPGSVRWHQLSGGSRTIYRRFSANANYTAALHWLLVRIKGAPADLTLAIYSDAAGNVGTEQESITVAYTRMDDILSEWLCETISQALTNGTYYWLVIYADDGDDTDNHWLIGVNNASGTTYLSGDFTTTPDAADFDLYYRLTTANSEKTCIPFEYKEQQYFVVSPTSGAPEVFMAGDRGAADSNSGQLSKLIDATKSWTTDEHVGNVVMIIAGTGKDEPRPWRTITANAAGSVTVDEDWTITQDTTTEYVIFGSKITSLGACGLTAPITDILVSTTGVVYMCMGDSVTIRALRAFNNSGTWLNFDNAANCQRNETDGKSKAVFMVYKPQAQTIMIGNNADVNADVSINTNTNTGPTIPAWGTSLTWGATPVKVDSRYRRITGMITHPDAQGEEAVWVFKTDIPFIIPSSGNPYPVNLEEMKTVRSLSNGVRPLRHNVYLYFPLQQGLVRYYGGQFDDIGPNLGEGLPENRRGSIVWMQGYPGKFFIAIDAGESGYSSILDSDGWHERYRAPLGQRLKSMAFQVVPGTALDRLWIYQGNDLIWLPFPSETVNELEDANYPYTHEFAVILSRMHAGMFDVQKLVKKIKLQTESLEVDSTSVEPICWFELDYRLNDDAAWTTFDDAFVSSPTQEIDLTTDYGLAGKRLQFRVRGYTTDNSKTPVFLAIIVNAVLRTDVKYMYSMQFRLMDYEPTLAVDERETMTAMQKLEILEGWADASTDTMLKMKSVSPLYNDKVIFLNPPRSRQIRFRDQEKNENPFERNVFLCEATIQEA